MAVVIGPQPPGKQRDGYVLQDQLKGPAKAQLISADSALVYRGMDIGTAKPTAQELAAYPHRLIDIRDPSEPYSAADFVNDADAAIVAALEQQQTPIIVGGTMLYVQRFINGIAELPGADSAMRLELQEQLAQLGGTAMHAQLSAIRPRGCSEDSSEQSSEIVARAGSCACYGTAYVCSVAGCRGRYRNQSAANKAGYGSRCADPATNFTSAHSRAF